MSEKATTSTVSLKHKNAINYIKYVATKSTVNAPQITKPHMFTSEGNYKEGKLVHNKILIRPNLPFKKSNCVDMPNNVLKNVKLLLTKEETVSSYVNISNSVHSSSGSIGQNTSGPCMQNALNATQKPVCSDIIFTSENAQSNDDTGHLQCGTSCQDMGSLFEVNVSTDSMIDSLDIKNNTQKATELIGEATQTKTNYGKESTLTNERTNSMIDSLDIKRDTPLKKVDFFPETTQQRSNNAKGSILTYSNFEHVILPQSTQKKIKKSTEHSKDIKIQHTSKQNCAVQQRTLLPATSSLIKQTQAFCNSQALTPICVDGDVKIVMTKGQYYIQHKQQHNNHNVIVLSPLTAENLLPVLPAGEISNGAEKSTSDVPNCVAMGNNELTDVCAESTVCTTPSTSEIEAQRRERLRLAKRALRMDPNYRARESAKCRLRMQVKRLDPNFREKERQKDRIRRAKSRKQNITLRNREKERDRAYQYYKKMQQNIHEAVMPLFLEEEVNCGLTEDIVVATANEDIDDTDTSLNL